jgi:putative ABC transport system permease protein
MRPRRTPFAWLAVVHAPIRTAVAVAGTAFAVFLIFMELFFDSTIGYTAGAVWKRLDFDLAIVSSGFREVTMTVPFPRRRLAQALGVPDVARVSPLYARFVSWRHPETRSQARVVLFGFRPEDRVFRVPEAADLEASLRGDDAVAADRLSFPACGPLAAGTSALCERRRVRVASQFTLGAGFLASGAIFASDLNFGRITGVPLDGCHMGLVRVAEGADREAVAAALRRTLPQDVIVLTPEKLGELESWIWEKISSSGKITKSGVGLALLVTFVVLLQILSTEIAQRLPEFATLSALGYDGSFIRGVVLRHALILAGLGYAVGLVLATGLARVVRRLLQMPIELTPARALAVLAATVVVCGLSALLALGKLERADPADLF